MKLILYAILILGAHCLRAEVDLKGKQPEDFDWFDYVDAGNSTSTHEEMVRAQEGVAILRRRMDTLCTEYRKLLTSPGEKEAIRLFDEMQARWKQSSDAEVALISSAWNAEGPGAAAYPEARLHSYLRRVKELKDIAARCMLLNK